jgi:hypothetical protein
MTAVGELSGVRSINTVPGNVAWEESESFDGQSEVDDGQALAKRHQRDLPWPLAILPHPSSPPPRKEVRGRGCGEGTMKHSNLLCMSSWPSDRQRHDGL